MTEEFQWQTNPNGIAILAGGCFWCMQPPYADVPGVKRVLVGYTGGEEEAPDYKQVAGGYTDHAEAVLIEFDEATVSYEQILEVFWRNINPAQSEGQFYDLGPHYRTGIFYTNDAQKAAAEKSKADLAASGKFGPTIATEVTPAGRFWVGEEYHQDYYKKNPEHYNSYKTGSGRAAFIESHWGDE